MISHPILIIGPMGGGKSTIAAALSHALDIPRVPLDMVRWYYYFKNGYSVEKEERFESFQSLLSYWKPFELLAVKKVINDFPNSIIDFGAGHSYYPKKDELDEVVKACEKIPNIFLLLPSDDKELSLRICKKRIEDRTGNEMSRDQEQANRDFVFHESNFLLAKHVIYTSGLSVEDTAMEVAKRLVY